MGELKRKLSKKEAKARALAVWTYLAEHPEASKSDLPYPLWRKIEHCLGYCPLCELFDSVSGAPDARCEEGCPIQRMLGCCEADESVYRRWNTALHVLRIPGMTDDARRKATEERIEAASAIKDAIAAWEV